MKKLIFFIKASLFRRRALYLYNELISESQLPESKREEIATSRLASIIRHAYKNTDFYKWHYDNHGYNVNTFQSLEDMSHIPPVTKDHISQYVHKFRDKKCPEKYFNKSVTGGSSGIPTTVYHDGRIQLEGFGWYLMKLWNAHPGMNAAFLERYNPTKNRHKWLTYLNQMIWWPTLRVHLDITNVTESALWEFYNRCRKIKPEYIEGYVGAIYEFAKFVVDKNLEIPSVRFVWTTSSPLTASTRRLISRAFECPVYDQYGCCEIYWLGAEVCKKGGLHVFDTHRHLEIVKDSGDYCGRDEYGSLLMTDMLNYAFPLIRYENGDRGSWALTCDCNLSKFKRINPVQGRITENISLVDGGFIPGEFLTTIFDDYPKAVNQFQVIQEKDLSVKINFVPNQGKSAELELNAAKEHINKIFRNTGLKVSFYPLSDIPHDVGKLRYVISHACED